MISLAYIAVRIRPEGGVERIRKCPRRLGRRHLRLDRFDHFRAGCKPSPVADPVDEVARCGSTGVSTTEPAADGGVAVDGLGSLGDTFASGASGVGGEMKLTAASGPSISNVPMARAVSSCVVNKGDLRVDLDCQRPKARKGCAVRVHCWEPDGLGRCADRVRSFATWPSPR